HGAGLALPPPLVRRSGHFERPLRRLGDEGVEGSRGLHRPDVRLGQLACGERALRQPGESVRHGEIGKIGHYSTTFGTAKKPCAVSGALARILSRQLPSVTTSGRRAKSIRTTLVIGSTPVVSTSFSCSIQPRMLLSSPASGSRSLSGTLIRARVAIWATADLSSDIVRASPM